MTAPRTIAVQDQVLAVLRDNDPLPTSTHEICKQLGVRRHSDTGLVVYRVLRSLTNRGKAERLRFDGMTEAYWRAA